MQWEIVGCSAIGTKHITGGTPCQDAVCYERISDQIIIGAVSDGMGSARRSDVGSKLAVQTALSQIKSTQCWLNQPKNDEGAREIFQSVLGKVQAALKQKAENEGYSVEDLNCTLLAFIATPEWLAAMQVGDGLIVVRPKDENYRLLFMPDKGEHPNETTPVISSDALEEMQVCVKLDAYEFICVATDGIENISLVKSEKWRPFEGFFEPLEEKVMLSINSRERKQKEIEDYLNSEQINQKTNDDKTLLLCAYSDFTNIQKQNNVSHNNLKHEIANTQQSTRSGTVQPSTHNTVSQKQKEQENIDYEIAALREHLLEKLADHGITPEIYIQQSCLVFHLISDHPFPDKDGLSRFVRKAVLNTKRLRTNVSKIEVYNFTRNSKNPCWQEEFHVSGSLNMWFQIATIITLAGVMTLVFGLIKTFLAGILSIIICFIFSLALISCIWFLRVRTN